MGTPRRAALGTLSLVVLLFGACAAPPHAPQHNNTAQLTGWLRTERPVRTWKACRDRNVVLQRFDYSCGAGALATLMRYYFDDPVSEEEILLDILGSLTPAQVRDREENGLSLLDLKRSAERRGYQAAGVGLNYKSLKQLQGPVLIHMERENYKHFAVFKGIRGDRVELADPSRGNVRLPVSRFARQWSGVALVLGKKGFGLPRSYPLAPDDGESVRLEMQTARRSLIPVGR